MKLIAISLIALVLSGCAATQSRNTAEVTAYLSIADRQRLQTELTSAPDMLRHEILKLADANMSQTAESHPSRDALINILMHSVNPTLMPDASFENIQRVVSGDTQQLHKHYVNALTDYLTQTGFVCQQPVYTKYFTQRYGPNRGVIHCTDKIPFNVFTQYDGTKLVWIDLKRVKSIHLLFAGKSKSLASRFGHIALRLVICPEGKDTEAECNANLFEHLVLGFQANIDDLSLDTLKALNGKYKAYLFANQFMDVYENYAIDEFREMYSIPLKLDETSRNLMVRSLSDIHWRYAGDYSFFTHNCATMMQDAIKVAWPEFIANDQLQSNYLRPDSLFEAIKASPLADGNSLSSLEIAEREGHFFSSTRQFYEDALSEVQTHLNNPTFTDLDSYLRVNPLIRKQQRKDDLHFAALLGSDRHLREAQIMLEEYAVLSSERQLLIEGARYLEEQDFLTKEKYIHSQLDPLHDKIFIDCLLTPYKQRNNPMRRQEGIPVEANLTEVSNLNSVCRLPQNKLLLHEAIENIRDAKSELWMHLNAVSQYWSESIENLNDLKQI